MIFSPKMDIYLSAAPVHEEVKVQAICQEEMLALLVNPKRRR